MKYFWYIGILLMFASTATTAVTRIMALHYRLNGIQNPDILKNVSATLQNMHDRTPPPITLENALRFSDKVPKAIREAMAPYGYFKPQITTSLSKTPNAYLVTINVTPGPPLPIRELTARVDGPGKTDPLFV